MSDTSRTALQLDADESLKLAGKWYSAIISKITMEDVAQKYKVAADDLFNDKNDYQAAAKAYEEAAAIFHNQAKLDSEMADCLDKASKAWSKVSPSDSARCLRELISYRKSQGEYRRAAKPQEELAGLYEIELGDTKAAIEAWQTAGQWYENDRGQALANKCFLKVADLSALDGNYPKAIEMYEGVAQASVQSNLMRFSVKDYLLKAGICVLAMNDMVGMNRALDRYRALDNSFSQQREHLLLVDLTQAVEAGDPDTFSDKLAMYDQMSKLGRWKEEILLRVKNNIGEAEDDFS